ncbi:MAG: ATP-binding protein [Chlorobi bacterium]|nr:ATP-binding protein [Chlorobiota bacterium]MCI0716028.1 ATP-binding protein [Chlorobiota bacterium]
MKKKAIEISSSRSEIKKVEELFLDVNEEFKLPDEDYRRLMIAVTEILMNAIVHGNKENYTKKVLISVEYNNEKMKVVINDEGKGFEIESLPDPTLKENLMEVHGRGIFIAKSMVDEFEYRLSDNGSEFILVVKKK